MPKLGSTDKLSVYAFGRELLETNDLDPVYVLLNETKDSMRELQHWLLAYWCFYHMGTSSWIADGARATDGQYWARMDRAAGSKDYPRCHERRHFRGKNAANSVAYLRSEGLANLFRPFLQIGQWSLKPLMDYVQEWVGFGPWIAFKVADMLERLDITKVAFDEGAMFLFKSPKEGAELLVAREWDCRKPKETSNWKQTWAVQRILDKLGHYKAPPRYERLVNCQEAETILCKWKSYMGGHYRIGEDIESCKKGLERFPESPLSQRLLAAGATRFNW